MFKQIEILKNIKFCFINLKLNLKISLKIKIKRLNTDKRVKFNIKIYKL